MRPILSPQGKHEGMNTTALTAAALATDLDRLATDTRSHLIKEVFGELGQQHSHVFEYVDHLRTQCELHIQHARYEDLPFHLRRGKDLARYKKEFNKMFDQPLISWHPSDR